MNEMSDLFGSTDPKRMPSHFFFGAVQLGLSSAVRANIDKQNYSVCPRHWYIDATFRCQDCDALFTWTADEQRTWFEEYAFYVDSQPTRCTKCRRGRRQLKLLRQEYDRTVGRARAGGSLEEKKRVLSLIDQIEEASRTVPKSFTDAIDNMFRTDPTGIERTRTLLLKQVQKAERLTTADGPNGAEEPS
jgi:hypothetical protein